MEGTINTERSSADRSPTRVSNSRGVPYRLTRQIGAGGMAEVFAAEKLGAFGFEKEVVVKRILPHLAANPDFEAMFVAEAKLVAQLEHPNIAQVFDLGRLDGSLILTMEYVRGPSLERLMETARRRGEPLSVSHALSIASGVARGLHYAHRQRDRHGRPLGLVHRDVSPGNILLTPDGFVKLADFGVAKSLASVVVTEAGICKGKAPYMSPEQCLATTIDRRTDVFSLGVVLYEMLTGHRLFTATLDIVAMRRILSDPIAPPSSLQPALPPGLDAIVMRALERDPDRRYHSAGALADDIEALAHRCHLGIAPSSVAQLLRRWGLVDDPLSGPRRAWRPEGATPEQTVLVHAVPLNPSTERRPAVEPEAASAWASSSDQLAASDMTMVSSSDTLDERLPASWLDPAPLPSRGRSVVWAAWIVAFVCVAVAAGVAAAVWAGWL